VIVGLNELINVKFLISYLASGDGIRLGYYFYKPPVLGNMQWKMFGFLSLKFLIP